MYNWTMNINQDFFSYLKPYLIKLQEKIGADFVVFGSAPLYLLSVVEFNGKINDLDISVKDISVIPDYAEKVTFQKNQNQIFYKIVIDDMEIDIASLWPGGDYFFNKVYSNPIIIDNFKFANLDIVEDWKKEMVKKYGRQKDKEYLKKIKEFREINNSI